VRGSGDRRQLTAEGMVRLRESLTERDLAILHAVAELRLMSGRQLQQLHFPVAEHGNRSAATRATQRVLRRLTDSRLLLPLKRRIGGVRAGSAGVVVAPSSIGHRLVAHDERRHRHYEPGLRFVEHTLAIGQLVVDLRVHARAGTLDLLDCQAEPRSWREFGHLHGRQILKPDLYLAIGCKGWDLRWFAEIDRATESLPVIQRKCRLYADYHQTGIEQGPSGVFPRVCWITPDQHRASRVARLIQNDRRLLDEMFVVTTTSEATETLQRVGT
jgi:hypothetical protein